MKEQTIEKKNEHDTSPGFLSLTPEVDKKVRKFLAQPDLLRSLSSALGSPLNLIFPQLIKENLNSFKEVLTKNGLRHKIFFAHKCNRSDSLIKELVFTDACVDVSSIEELKHVLGCGFSADRIQATGPKNRDFLILALLHDITISVDSLWELKEIIAQRHTIERQNKSRILVRVSGFHSGHANFKPKASRFGIPIDTIDSALELLESHNREIDLLGFAYHIDTVSIPEKALALENCLELIETAYDYGFEPTVINIGGGFKVNYLENEAEWNQYTTAMKEAVLGSHSPVTWHNATFGLSANKGTLRGSLNIYNYYDTSTGAKFLEELLAYKLVNLNNSTSATLLRENGIELWIEPGRSLISQCGITVARVNSLKESSQSDILVCLNMKRQDVCFIDQEMFADPIIIRQNGDVQSTEMKPHAVYFAGNLCLESDLVTKRKVFLPTLPAPGDLAVFVNTAGYFMDFSASNSIMQPVARKAAIFEKDDKFHWTLDEEYQPWLGDE